MVTTVAEAVMAAAAATVTAQEEIVIAQEMALVLAKAGTVEWVQQR